jgi:uncharacterized protein YigA (DUF484 family)
MADWTIWATFLTLGSAAAILMTYLLGSVRLEQTNNRVLVLEKEIELMRTREEANDRKLMKILDAVTALRGTTEEHLDKLRERLDQLRADGYFVSS